jgi:integrase
VPPTGAIRSQKRRHDLVDVVPPGPRAWDQADEIRRQFVAQIKHRRSPQASATISQLMDCYLDQHQGSGARTASGYREYVDPASDVASCPMLG